MSSLKKIFELPQIFEYTQNIFVSEDGLGISVCGIFRCPKWDLQKCVKTQMPSKIKGCASKASQR